MKLLFDQNLSFKLCGSIFDLFPGSTHVRSLGLAESSDRDVWAYACQHGLTIVSQDADFADMAAVLGPPPKVIWLRIGNQSSDAVLDLLRRHSGLIRTFDQTDAACLEIYGYSNRQL